uniref:Probable protein-export membrane protein SecG n=1 Tax=Rhodymenia pseudopalmata TaxID=31502 RepID=A0A1C9C7E1_RHOPU|nr:preprotein translocase subunit G [Rhodymenia pseudopalmata]AOM64293.1 preprotein translocase subunit G [Rhodymenia pseudopalmata]
MKLIWYLISFLTVFLILLNNPKATDLGSFGGNQKVLSLTRGSQKKMQILTVITASIFFILTVFFALYSYD